MIRNVNNDQIMSVNVLAENFVNIYLATPIRVLFAFPQLLTWVWDVAIRAARFHSVQSKTGFIFFYIKKCSVHQDAATAINSGLLCSYAGGVAVPKPLTSSIKKEKALIFECCTWG